jgi:hypothetical protein
MTTPETQPAKSRFNLSVPPLLRQAVYLWLVVGVLVLVFGALSWAFGSGGTLGDVVKSAILWPAHLAR